MISRSLSLYSLVIPLLVSQRLPDCSSVHFGHCLSFTRLFARFFFRLKAK
jgi:hypothetical protein